MVWRGFPKDWYKLRFNLAINPGQGVHTIASCCFWGHNRHQDETKHPYELIIVGMGYINLVPTSCKPWEIYIHGASIYNMTLLLACPSLGFTYPAGVTPSRTKDRAHMWVAAPYCIPCLGTKLSGPKAECDCLIWPREAIRIVFSACKTRYSRSWSISTDAAGGLYAEQFGSDESHYND